MLCHTIIKICYSKKLFKPSFCFLLFFIYLFWSYRPGDLVVPDPIRNPPNPHSQSPKCSPHLASMLPQFCLHVAPCCPLVAPMLNQCLPHHKYFKCWWLALPEKKTITKPVIDSTFNLCLPEGPRYPVLTIIK